MKFLCLAYGAGSDWEALSEEERRAALANDDVLRARGDFVTAVEPQVLTVRAWDGTPTVVEAPFAELKAPLAGFAIIEANDANEVIALVAGTPCARARGAIEIRPIME